MNNFVNREGGGVILINNSTAEVSIQGFKDGGSTTNSVIQNNEIKTGLNGASIYVQTGKLNVKECSFKNNKHNNSTTRSISVNNGAYFNNVQNSSGKVEAYGDKDYI